MIARSRTTVVAGVLVCVLVLGLLLVLAQQAPHSQTVILANGLPIVGNAAEAGLTRAAAESIPQADRIADAGMQRIPAMVLPETQASPDVNKQVRELRRVSIELLAQRFERYPSLETSKSLLVECLVATLDAAGDFVVLPNEGVVDDSSAEAKLPPGERWMIQLIGDIQVRKYKVTQTMFPLYHELENQKPEGLFTGKPELTPEQIQAVKDQLEIARELTK